jgi:PIN domain nuclease of toxin-antitoxin system
MLHRDPFDRALIAQAMVENLIFPTTDERLASYASPNFSVIS